jgi:hypothetical protein
MSLMISEFIQKKNCLIRGLAHPVIFSNSSDFSLRDLYVKYGAVPVSPMSYYEVRSTCI